MVSHLYGHSDFADARCALGNEFLKKKTALDWITDHTEVVF